MMFIRKTLITVALLAITVYGTGYEEEEKSPVPLVKKSKLKTGNVLTKMLREYQFMHEAKRWWNKYKKSLKKKKGKVPFPITEEELTELKRLVADATHMKVQGAEKLERIEKARRMFKIFHNCNQKEREHRRSTTEIAKELGYTEVGRVHRKGLNVWHKYEKKLEQDRREADDKRFKQCMEEGQTFIEDLQSNLDATKAAAKKRKTIDRLHQPNSDTEFESEMDDYSDDGRDMRVDRKIRPSLRVKCGLPANAVVPTPVKSSVTETDLDDFFQSLDDIINEGLKDLPDLGSINKVEESHQEAGSDTNTNGSTTSSNLEDNAWSTSDDRSNRSDD